MSSSISLSPLPTDPLHQSNGKNGKRSGEQNSSEIMPSKRTKPSILDASSSLQLINLPHLPLLRVLRFLDEKSLNEMRLTCRSTNDLINSNRIQLPGRSVFLVEIGRKMIDMKTTYDLSIHKNNYKPDNKVFDCLKDLDSSTFPSSFLWLAANLPNRRIKNLLLKQFSFHEEDLEIVEKALEMSNLRIETVELCNTNFGDDVSSTFRFLSAVNPQYVHVCQMDKKSATQVFVESFFTKMSKLRYIEIETSFSQSTGPAFMRLPEHIPNEFSSCKVTSKSKFELLTIINNWYNSGNEFACTLISMDVRFPTVPKNVKNLAKELSIPHEIIRDRGQDKMLIRNLGGEKLCLYPLRDCGDAEMPRRGSVEWSLEGGRFAEEE